MLYVYKAKPMWNEIYVNNLEFIIVLKKLLRDEWYFCQILE